MGPRPEHYVVVVVEADAVGGCQAIALDRRQREVSRFEKADDVQGV